MSRVAQDGNEFRFMIDLLRGDRRGPVASCLRGLLWVAQWPYIAAVSWRNRRFNRGVGVSQVDVPVVSIGNITTGGTGKTPAVAWLCRFLRDHEVRVAILSRGYRADQSGVNDEALELEQRLPDVPHLQNPDRVQSARIAIEELESQCLVLDDGFQHRRLHRDIDWVLVDALNPLGFGNCLPRGLLREPKSSLRRADALLITRADQIPQAKLESLVKDLRHVVGDEMPIVRTVHRCEGWRDSEGLIQPLDTWNQSRVAAFCGIGNPEAFRSTLQSQGCDVVAWRTFPDHHRYDRNDVQSLSDWVQQHDVRAVVCTAKDLVKLNATQIGGVPVRALQIGFDFIDDPQLLLKQITSLLPPS
jgi:tetraacyldisaccharide 4'-kinase